MCVGLHYTAVLNDVRNDCNSKTGKAMLHTLLFEECPSSVVPEVRLNLLVALDRRS